MKRSLGASGAYFELSGEQPNNSTWQENIYFMEAGSPMILTDLDFEMTFKRYDCDNADFILSTMAGTLSIETDPDSGVANILYINVPAGNLAGLCGDYVADLASKDANGVITPWAHGTVTFQPLPNTFQG